MTTTQTAPATGRHTSWMPWVTLLARVILGVTLIVAGALKVTEPLSSGRAVNAYQIFPYDVAMAIGYALPIVEIVIGLLLVLGLFTRFAAIAGSLLMAAFIVGIASAWARGLSIDCGCFGGGGTIAPEDTNYSGELLRDAGLLLCGLWTVWRPHTRLSLDALLWRVPVKENNA